MSPENQNKIDDIQSEVYQINDAINECFHQRNSLEMAIKLIRRQQAGIDSHVDGLKEKRSEFEKQISEIEKVAEA